MKAVSVTVAMVIGCLDWLRYSISPHEVRTYALQRPVLSFNNIQTTF